MTSQWQQPNDRELIHTRILRAPRERVFAVWTDPAHLAEWWGPRGFRTTTHAMELRAGGTWRFTMHGPDGRDYENRIEYLEVRQPELLVYRHTGDEEVEPVRFQVVVSFSSLGEKTLLTMRMTFESPTDLAHVEDNYGASEGALETLARLTERLAQMSDDAGPSTKWHYGDAAVAPWEPGPEGQKIKRLASASGVHWILSEVVPGFEGPVHVHPGIEGLYVLSGSVINEGRRLGTGEACLAEGGTKHSEFRSEEGATFLVVFQETP
ncbi:MAG: SRPBCC domain-containing protein [Planctomycetota bacterium]